MSKIKLTQEQEEAINKAIESYNQGNWITDEEAEREIQRWFDDKDSSTPPRSGRNGETEWENLSI